jgi:hypothetical protein
MSTSSVKCLDLGTASFMRQSPVTAATRSSPPHP